MAIVTGNYKGFTFGDISSKAYGVYITQEAAYNAPERDTEVIEIAGRNGAYILDKGRFLNITVSYKCGIALDSEQTFESAIRAFRNALSSKAGKYVRLEDEYNPDEYRQAAFLGGIDVDMADRRAGEFTVSFDAKPQRFLKSGENEINVTNGQIITNPTLFEASPLLEAKGKGDILFRDEPAATITESYVGDLTLSSSVTQSGAGTGVPTPMLRVAISLISADMLNSGDAITLNGIKYTWSYKFPNNVSTISATNASMCSVSASKSGKVATFVANVDAVNLASGTDVATRTIASYDFSAVDTANNNVSGGHVVQLKYDSSAETITIYYIGGYTNNISFKIEVPPITGYSTKSNLPNSIYIDLDIGEAYYIDENDEIASINNVVVIPAQLPVLTSGENEITYDNTITQLKVTPRWWEV